MARATPEALADIEANLDALERLSERDDAAGGMARALLDHYHEHAE